VQSPKWGQSVQIIENPCLATAETFREEGVRPALGQMSMIPGTSAPARPLPDGSRRRRGRSIVLMAGWW
jgi:hypothetical protein